MLTETASEQQDDSELDPTFVHARREAIVIFFVWAAGLLWAVPFCYFNGYLDRLDGHQVSTTLGMPTWLFWGIFVPWIVADVVTVWFCFCYMQDDDLGEEDDRTTNESLDDVTGKESQV